MTATRTPTPITTRAGCRPLSAVFAGAFFFGFFGCCCGGDSGGASAVIGRRRLPDGQQWPSGDVALLAGTGPELAGEIQLVGAPRGQMLANAGAHRAAKYHVHRCARLLSPAVNPAFTHRSAAGQERPVATRRSVASPTPDPPHSETRCGWSRCPVIAVSAPPDGSGGNTPAHTGANRPSRPG